MSASKGVRIVRLPGRVWRLGEVLRTYAVDYLALGQSSEQAVDILTWQEVDKSFTQKTKKEAEEEEKRWEEGFKKIRKCLNDMEEICDKLRLPVSKKVIKRFQGRTLITREAFNVLIDTLSSEIDSVQLFHIQSDKIKYYDCEEILSIKAASAFKDVHKELMYAGTCYACDLSTACVFHSMRAAEIGVRALGKSIGVSFPDKPIELAEWHQILDQVESRIRAIGQQPKSAQRDADQKFYSAAASQFRYFKDGWRVHVAHARAVYTESEALKILDHTRDFFESLSERFSEG